MHVVLLGVGVADVRLRDGVHILLLEGHLEEPESTETWRKAVLGYHAARARWGEGHAFNQPGARVDEVGERGVLAAVPRGEQAERVREGLRLLIVMDQAPRRRAWRGGGVPGLTHIWTP